VKDCDGSALAHGRAQLAIALGDDAHGREVLARFDRWGPDLADAVSRIYPGTDAMARIVELIVKTDATRPAPLRERDRARLLEPDWFQRPDTVGYAAYTDLFAGDLQGVRTRIDYLNSLHVTYLHLMPLLQPRPGANDGGYAVADYRAVRPDLGTMDDLAELASDLHEHGISLALDLVLNHVAREHDWAARAEAGESKYREYFLVFPDRTTPDAYEQTLPEVFPTFAPGNFTWNDALQGWVWTSFNEYQWDLNWANPDVFCEFADIIGFLANHGVDCVRLDAIAFLWKRMGTNCQNQPEVHDITAALRAFARIACPSLVFKAEAIVGPADVVAYLGTGRHAGKVSDLAYHNSLMVQIWSALATQDARLLVAALQAFPPIPVTGAWATYLRCHDDIGWAIDDANAAAVGWDGAAHRSFLADYFAGQTVDTVARGAHFQTNDLTGDRRTSGSAAALVGIEAALDSRDAKALERAIDRLLLAYALVMGYGGVPLLYMGDELALTNDVEYRSDAAKADDNRWMHRPPMDWAATQAAPGAVSSIVLERMRQLIEARVSLPALHASTASEPYTVDEPGLLFVRRRHASGDLVEVFNMTDQPLPIPRHALWPLPDDLVERISGMGVDARAPLTIPAFAAWWLTPSALA
jgi:amylosucrase